MSTPGSIVTFDARPLLRAGVEPFSKIRERAATLTPEQTLVVIAPFLPSPLIERFQADGLAVRVVHRSDGSWEVHFRRNE